MEITCYIAERCASRVELLENLQKALARTGNDTGSYHLLGEAEAERLAIKGSPTVLINGRDIAAVEAGSGSC